jgi:hypothetical protein
VTNTPREKVLTLLLPSCLIVLVYAWMAQDKKQPGLAQMKQSLEAARAQAVPSAAVALQSANLAAVKKKIADLEKDKVRLTAAWQASAAHCTTIATRPDRANRLHALLKSRALLLVDSSPGDSAKDGRLSPALEKLSKLLAERTGQPPQVWRYRVQGSYKDVLQALQDLSQDDQLAIPIGLTMKDANSEISTREWTLLVWI